MFKTLKGMLHVAEQVEKVNDRFEELIQSIQTHTEDIKGFKTEIDGLRDTQSKLSAQIKQDSSDFTALKDDLKKEIVDFKILKSKMEKSIIESFEEQLKAELLPKFNKLESHVKKFEDLGEAIKTVGARTMKLSDEMAKFQEISSSIKKVDFELVQAARHLKASESEKTELLRKIDTLERLVSKMRRRQ